MAGTTSSRKRNSDMFSSLPNVSIQDKLAPQGVFLRPAVKYNIDDGAWSDKVDPTTGSLHYVLSRPESRLTSSGAYASTSSSSSNSSLSSLVSPEMSPSRQPSSYLGDSLAGLLSHSPSMSEYRHSPPASNYSHSPSMSVLEAKASRGDGRNMMAERKSPTSAKSIASDQRYSESFGFSSTIAEARASHRSFLSPHQGDMRGSRGLPLDENSACVTRVKIDLAQYQIGMDGNPCSLELLGIVPTRGSTPRQGHKIFASGRFSMRSHHRHIPGHAPVIIRDVAKGSPAAATQQLQQGDTIIAVNGCHVDMSNIDSTLRGITDEVQLMVRKYSVQSPPSPIPSLSKLVAGSKVTLRVLSNSLRSHPHLILYLTLDTREDDHPDMDILYRYPAEGAERLLQTRGLFLTLSDIMGTIGHDSLSCSSIMLDGHLMHLGYIQSGKELVLLALPANVASSYHIRLLVKDIQKMLELMFRSPALAFKNRKNHLLLDHVFSMFFQKNLEALAVHCTTPLKGMSLAPVLSIPLDLKLKLSTALTELDAIDRSSLPEVMCAPSPYRQIGSCLFYQGTLVCSHLGNNDLQSVVLFCNAYRLLELTAAESVDQIVIWRQIWLPNDEDAPNGDSAYLLQTKNTYIMVVGVDRVIICTLLESCQSGVEGVATVDTTRVENAHTLIEEMRTNGLFEGLDRMVSTTTLFPSMILADVAMATMFSLRHRNSSSMGDIQGSDSDDETPPPAASRTSSVSLFKFQKKDLSLPSLSLVGGHSKSFITGVPRPADMLNAGTEPIVLHYIDLQAGRGVMLCPIHTIPMGAVHKELLECFAEVCGCIRQTMWRRRRRKKRCGQDTIEDDDCSETDGEDEEEEEEEGEQRRPQPIYTGIPSASSSSSSPLPNPSVIEQGVLISCSVDQSSADKHHAPSFDYWVVGRLFPDTRREFYVCFVDNTSQNIIEMAFRLAFGTVY